MQNILKLESLLILQSKQGILNSTNCEKSGAAGHKNLLEFSENPKDDISQNKSLILFFSRFDEHRLFVF